MCPPTLVIAFVAACAVAVGCSSTSAPAHNDPADSGAGGAAGDGSDTVSCGDPRAQAYSAGMKVSGSGGVYTFVLVSSTPAPPANENNVFVIQIQDSTGQAVTGATLTAKATMPQMSHGTSTVNVTPNSDGTYTLQPLYFFMPGLWQVDLTAQSGSQKDDASFFFCVAG
jgi:hypothetical protein